MAEKIDIDSLLNLKEIGELPLLGRKIVITQLKSGHFAAAAKGGKINIYNPNTFAVETTMQYGSNQDRKTSGQEIFDLLDDEMDGLDSEETVRYIAELDDGRIIAWIRGQKIKSWNPKKFYEYEEIPLKFEAKRIQAFKGNKLLAFDGKIFTFYSLETYKELGKINLDQIIYGQVRDSYDTYKVKLFYDYKRNQLLVMYFEHYKGIFSLLVLNLDDFSKKTQIVDNEFKGMWARGLKNCFFPIDEDRVMMFGYTRFVIFNLDSCSIEKQIQFDATNYYIYDILPFYVKDEELIVISLKQGSEDDMENTIDEVDDNLVSFFNIKNLTVKHSDKLIDMMRFMKPIIIGKNRVASFKCVKKPYSEDSDEEYPVPTGIAVYSYE